LTVLANSVRSETIRHPAGVGCGERPASRDGRSERLHRYFSTRQLALRNQIVRDHADLAYRLAGKFTGRGEPFEDLVQVAFIGLIQAVDRFDPTAGVALESFAVPTILGELKRHFRDRAWSMRVPRRLQEIYLEAKAMIDPLTQELGRSPTYTEIAARLEITEEDLVGALEAGQNFYALSLDVPPPSENGTTAAPLGRDDPGLLSVENRRLITALADGLPDRTRVAVQLRFGKDMTQSEIARQLGVSQMHVSRMLAKAMHHMRQRVTLPLSSHP
jgi:RNA polymerase sigma-B factor